MADERISELDSIQAPPNQSDLIPIVSGGITKSTTVENLLSVVNASTPDWTDITNKPATFTPSIHSHTSSDVTDFGTAVDTRISNVIGSAPAVLDTLGELADALGDDSNFAVTMTTALSGKAPTAHTHTKTQVTDFAHTHAEAEITGLVADLAAKASSAHSHAQSDVTGLMAGLAAKQPLLYTGLANGTLAMALGTNNVVKVTPTANSTFTTTVPAAGTRCQIIILTAGVSSFTITFGSGFKPTGTLATGTTAARVFVINWVSDGTNLYEAGRTAAMVA